MCFQRKDGKRAQSGVVSSNKDYSIHVIDED